MFVCRDLGPDFDHDLYNEMATKIWNNSRYQEYFQPWGEGEGISVYEDWLMSTMGDIIVHED